MRFVFVTDELPRPGRAGHLTMNHAIIVWLQSFGHHVTILLTAARLDAPVARYVVAPVAGPEVAGRAGLVVATSLRAQARIVARRLLTHLPASLGARLRQRVHAHDFAAADAVLGTFITPAQTAWCAGHIARTSPDAVLIDTLFRAPLLQAPELRGRRGVIIAHDVFHRRHQALTAAGHLVHPASLDAAQEARWLGAASAVIAIQPEEAAVIRTMCPATAVYSTPMPALPCPRPPGTARLPDRLVFVGSDNLPNRDGLRWFLASVWPLLQSRRGVSLDIAGDCGAAFSGLPEGVNRLGRVAALGPVLHRASLAIAPLLVGSGLKIKLLDYARHGLLTVTTPVGLAGFAADPAAPFIAAATAADFAAAILRRLGAPAEDGQALAYVQRHYGTAASFAGLAQALALAPLGPSFPEM